MLFSEPKIPQYSGISRCRARSKVSVLFSEPKIPQSRSLRSAPAGALMFQCSSASRKFLNLHVNEIRGNIALSFSALQRAENSSIALRNRRFCMSLQFQCSSASRKFLNSRWRTPATSVLERVSVLFSEPKIPQSIISVANTINNGRFQCSSASRKFLNRTPLRYQFRRRGVSVLFSEPKIPQSRGILAA